MKHVAKATSVHWTNSEDLIQLLTSLTDAPISSNYTSRMGWSNSFVPRLLPVFRLIHAFTCGTFKKLGVHVKILLEGHVDITTHSTESQYSGTHTPTHTVQYLSNYVNSYELRNIQLKSDALPITVANTHTNTLQSSLKTLAERVKVDGQHIIIVQLLCRFNCQTSGAIDSVPVLSDKGFLASANDLKCCIQLSQKMKHNLNKTMF